MLNNLKIKIVAVFLATILWFFIISSSNQVKSFDYSLKIEPLNLSDELVILYKNNLPEVEVYYRSSSQNIKSDMLSIKDFSASIELEGLEAGDYTLPIHLTANHPELEVVKYIPEVVDITIEKKDSKDFIFNIVSDGSIANGYRLTHISSNRDTVVITGASTVISTISDVIAKVELVGSESTDQVKRGVLVALDSNKRIIDEVEIVPPSVNVDLTVGLDEETKTIGLIPNLEKVTLQDGYFIKSIKLEPSIATIRGKHELLSKLDYLQTIRLTINDLDKDYETLLDLNVPEDISIIEPEDNKVLLKLKLESLSYQREIEPQIKIKNLPSFLDINILTPITVRLTGDPSSLDSLEKNDISVNIDFSGVNKVGTERFQIKKSDFIYPQSISLVDFTPKLWEVEIVYK